MPQYSWQRLDVIIPNASAEAIYIIEKCLAWNPEKRPTAEQILECEFFKQHVIYETTPLVKSKK